MSEAPESYCCNLAFPGPSPRPRQSELLKNVPTLARSRPQQLPSRFPELCALVSYLPPPQEQASSAHRLPGAATAVTRGSCFQPRPVESDPAQAPMARLFKTSRWVQLPQEALSMPVSLSCCLFLGYVLCLLPAAKSRLTLPLGTTRDPGLSLGTPVLVMCQQVAEQWPSTPIAFRW